MRGALLLAAVLLVCPPAFAQEEGRNPEGAYLPLFGHHAGNLLVARPGLPDGRFRRSVILLVRHDEKGAVGLILNRLLRRLPLAALYEHFGMEAPRDAGEVDVHYGGPVAPGAGFALHTREHELDVLYEVGENAAISRMEHVLQAIARGRRPRKIVFALGYAGWGAGQLEREMKRGDWYSAPADADIVFGANQAGKWQRAMERRFRMM